MREETGHWGRISYASDKEGDLDEVVALNPKCVHLERMDSNAWWLRIDLADGRAIVVNLYSTGRQHVNGFTEWD